MRTSYMTASLPILTLMLAGAGCGEDHDHGNENEVITTVTLTLVSAGGAPVVVKFDDPDGDGGNPPKVDALDIAAGMYDLTVKLENRLENPAEDITAEVRDEGDEHQIFFTGTAVKGPASNQASAPLTHSYADMDTKGLPIGIANKISATAGTGTLTVTLRHLPPVNGMPVKTAALPEQVRNGGFAAIGGSSDAQVNFQVNVR